MSNDELDRAIVALRQHRGGTSAKAERTEAAVMALVREQQRSRIRWRWMLPVAAICAASSAWAASHPELVRVVRAILSGGPDSSASSTASRLPPPSSLQPAIAIGNGSVSVTDAGSPLPSATSHVDASTLSAPGAPSMPILGLSSRSSVQSHSVDSSPLDAPRLQDRALRPAYELFRDAQQLQFSRKDPAAALAVWDQYLAVDPNGALALEARFNRGLCLVALGRSREAERALTPFAIGEYGEYRRQEARSILERLGNEPQ